MFLYAGADRDDDPQMAGDGGSTSMLEPTHDEEFLIDQNDTARLILPASLLIFLQNEIKTQLVKRG
jgi:hypothetical protein